MQNIMTPISWGELVDKITILAIKKERIKDPNKLSNVTAEYDALVQVMKTHMPASKATAAASLLDKLKQVNEELWVIEDDIRVCERNQDFGDEFVRLARAVYVTNDQRFLVKREINDLLGSALKEEKSYEDYSHAKK